MELNKLNYEQLAKKDIENFLACVEKKSETSDFKEALKKAYNALGILYQVIYG